MRDRIGKKTKLFQFVRLDRKRANVGNAINQIVPNRFTLKLPGNEPRCEQRVKFKSIHMRVRVYGARANYNAIPQRGFNNERK